jgi:hypothetical protein
MPTYSNDGTRWPGEWEPGRIFCAQAPPVTAQVRFVYCERKRRGQRLDRVDPLPQQLQFRIASRLGKSGTFLLQYMLAPVTLFLEFDLNFFFQKIWFMDHEDAGSTVRSVNHAGQPNTKKSKSKHIIIIYTVACSTRTVLQYY